MMGQAASGSNMMAASMATQGIASAGAGYANSLAYQSQGDFQRHQFETNAKFAEMRGADAIKRGDKAAEQHRADTKRVIGSQRAGLAAQGIDVNSGSALDIQSDTRAMGALDAMTIKNNAWRESWGYKTEALSTRSQGEYASMAANNNSRNTLLTGGLSAVSSGLQAGYYYKKG